MKEALQKRIDSNSLRSLSTTKSFIDFCSNDFLGFSRTGLLRKEISDYLKCVEPHKLEGSTGSRLLTGNSEFFEKLEQKIASFHNGEAALIFNSGYDANIGLLSSIAKRDDTILFDELVHASIHDGIRLSRAKAFSFRHNDLADLKKLLTHTHGKVYVVVESIYSMDGDKSHLVEIADLCESKKALLIVDEAHATGVFGKLGRGCVCENKLEKKVFARVHTFGKALGAHGAAVVGSSTLRTYLINFARSFIYSTALPYSSLVSVQCAYNLLQQSDEQMKSLHDNIKFFRGLMYGFQGLLDSSSAIQGIVMNGNEKVKKLAKELNILGFDVRPILSPTVSKGKERIRICLHAFNTSLDIRKLISAIERNIEIE